MCVCVCVSHLLGVGPLVQLPVHILQGVHSSTLNQLLDGGALWLVKPLTLKRERDRGREGGREGGRKSKKAVLKIQFINDREVYYGL